LLKCGLPPNPYDQFCDSIIGLVCKHANMVIFTCLLKHGSDLQVMDSFGRTPLHHACWASTFCRPIVEAILERDPIQLCIEDKHGETPLEYVRHDLLDEWMDFLEDFVEHYFEVMRVLRRPNGILPDPEKSI
jgi:ankyrin repeat protein